MFGNFWYQTSTSMYYEKPGGIQYSTAKLLNPHFMKCCGGPQRPFRVGIAGRGFAVVGAVVEVCSGGIALKRPKGRGDELAPQIDLEGHYEIRRAGPCGRASEGQARASVE